MLLRKKTNRRYKAQGTRHKKGTRYKVQVRKAV